MLPSLLPSPALLAAGLALFFPRDPSQEPSQAPAPEPPLASMAHAALNEALRALEHEHGDLVRVLPVGRSSAGAEILGVRIAKGDPPPGKPAILVVANVDGSQTWTSSLALFEAREIASGADAEPYRALLESATLLVIPCANPDAHGRAFETPSTDREATGTGVDDDRDGRSGEDGPSDVDGDGRITSLRSEDATGEWTADEDDERVLVRADAKKGQVGRWRLATEGRDLDRDEEIAEDAPLDARVNRNFPYGWEEHGGDAGAFPLDEPESRALVEFVLLHPEIALCVTYGSFDNLVEKPKTTKADARERRLPAPGVIEADADVLAELGKRYVELTANEAKGRGGDAGTFQGWMYAHRGVWSLAIQPWDIPLSVKDAEGSSSKSGGEQKEGEKSDAQRSGDETPPAAAKDERGPPGKDKKRGEPSDDVKRLKWIDANPGESWRFVPWKEAAHPELGRCEVGGFAPFARTEPPVSRSREIARKELEFLASLGPDLARVEIGELAARPLGAGVHEIRATITNRSRLGMQSASAVRAGAVRPLRVRLELSGDAELVAGRSLALERELGGGGAHLEYRWLVRASRVEDVRVRIDTDHAGRDDARAEVSR